MATEAAGQILKRNNLEIDEIDAVIATTGTPDHVTPSLASRVCASLAGSTRRPSATMSYDINAACSGYLYALQAVFDLVSRHPPAKALIITSEILSPLLNLEDPDTSCIFGDAATATLFTGTDESTVAKVIHSAPNFVRIAG